MKPIHLLEMLFLALVVLHAAHHFPRDVVESRRWVQESLETLFRRFGKPHGADVILRTLVVMATLVAVSPIVYYSLEWIVRIQPAHAA